MDKKKHHTYNKGVVFPRIQALSLDPTDQAYIPYNPMFDDDAYSSSGETFLRGPSCSGQGQGGKFARKSSRKASRKSSRKAKKSSRKYRKVSRK